MNKYTITYELIADKGEETETIFSTNTETKCLIMLKGIQTGSYKLDDAEEIKSISMNVVLTGKEIDIIKYENEMSAMVELERVEL